MNPREHKKNSGGSGNEQRILRRGIIPLATMLAVALGIAGNSYYYHSVKQTAHDTQLHRANAAKSRVNEARVAEEIIAEYLTRYDDYQRAGIIGTEHRIGWVQAVRDEAERHKIASLNYRLDPREPFTADYLFQDGGYQLTVSKMTLTWSLLHENDFVSVLNRLQDKRLGVYHVKECELRRVNDHISLTSTEANIVSDCELHWMSVDVSQLLEGAGS